MLAVRQDCTQELLQNVYVMLAQTVVLLAKQDQVIPSKTIPSRSIDSFYMHAVSYSQTTGLSKSRGKL